AQRPKHHLQTSLAYPTQQYSLWIAASKVLILPLPRIAFCLGLMPILLSDLPFCYVDVILHTSRIAGRLFAWLMEDLRWHLIDKTLFPCFAWNMLSFVRDLRCLLVPHHLPNIL
ncbi:hypothetical protein ACJX0J_012589, partial [Zea mays]